ncbi:MAG: hypothetical protein HOM11_16280 [Methylococcales bacterium]|jgi:DedD protein|nr:hypothetical protein [Methylococcales bacterium]MBT7444847.1 hypothetical protein [Methylococcales bacterium]
MNTQLKNRLVGAAVLFSFGVIFIPMLLNGKAERFSQAHVIVPPEPAAIEQDLAMPEPVSEEVIAKFESAITPVLASTVDAEPVAKTFKKDPVFQAKEQPKPIKTAVKSTLRNGFDKKTWVIQVGSFASANNAHGLTQKLQKLGYQAFEENIKTKKGEIVRVRVGPEIDIQKAKRIRGEIKSRMKLNGLVVQYP